MASRTTAIALDGTSEHGLWRVILASSVGTMIEWYAFIFLEALPAVLSLKFYPPGNDTSLHRVPGDVCSRISGAAVVSAFLRRIGDLVGRKYAFLVTLSIMGGATALIGPSHISTAKWFAPITLIVIRVLQGSTWRRIRRSGGLRCGARS